MGVSEEVTEHKGSNGRELDEDVNGGARGVLKRVTNGVTSNGGLMALSLLLHEDLLTGLGVSHLLGVELSSLNIFLGVVPSTTSVGEGEGNLDTRYNAASEETTDGLGAEETTDQERASNNEEARGDHHFKGSLGGNGNARVVVRFLLTSEDLSISELVGDFLDHIIGSVSDSLHGHGREGIGEHGADEEAGELDGREHVQRWEVGTGAEGSEESERHEAGRADGETLADGGSGITSGVKLISGLSDRGVQLGHLSNTTGVVRDGAVSVDG